MEPVTCKLVDVYTTLFNRGLVTKSEFMLLGVSRNVGMYVKGLKDLGFKITDNKYYHYDEIVTVTKNDDKSACCKSIW